MRTIYLSDEAVYRMLERIGIDHGTDDIDITPYAEAALAWQNLYDRHSVRSPVRIK